MGKNKKFVAGQNSSDLDTNEIVQEIIPENAQKKDEILGESGEIVGLEGRFGVKEKIAKLENLKGQSEQKGQKQKKMFLPNQSSDKKWGVEAAADDVII